MQDNNSKWIVSWREIYLGYGIYFERQFDNERQAKRDVSRKQRNKKLYYEVSMRPVK